MRNRLRYGSRLSEQLRSTPSEDDIIPKYADNLIITKTRMFKYIENFTTKNWKFSDKNSDIFHTSAQNIDCGYS